jgi:hypothetical protein
MVCVRIVGWIFGRGIVWGALLGALYGTFWMPIVGNIYGLFFGAVIGAIMGAVDAFALGATAHFFMDMNHPSRIIPWLRLIGITLNLIGVGLYMVALFSTQYALSQPLLFFMPPVLAALAAIYLVPRFVDYAVRIQQVTPSETTNIVSHTQTNPAR